MAAAYRRKEEIDPRPSGTTSRSWFAPIVPRRRRRPLGGTRGRWGGTDLAFVGGIGEEEPARGGALRRGGEVS
jgi:hypothetical protein